MADELSPTDGRNDGESSFIILQSDYGGLFQGEKQQRFWLIIFFLSFFLFRSANEYYMPAEAETKSLRSCLVSFCIYFDPWLKL